MNRTNWPLAVIPFAWWTCVPASILLGISGVLLIAFPAEWASFASLAQFLLAGLAAVALLWLGSRRFDRAVLGMEPAVGVRQGGVFLAGLALFYVGMFIISRAKGQHHTGASPEEAQALLGFGTSVLHDLGVILTVTVAAPIVEELIFRGLVFRGLRDGLTAGGFLRREGGPHVPAGIALVAAFVLSSLAFMSIHGGEGQDGLALEYIYYSLLLAAAFHFSGTIIVPMLLHAVTNAVSVLEVLLNEKAPDLSEPALIWLVWLGPLITLAIALCLRRLTPRAR